MIALSQWKWFKKEIGSCVQLSQIRSEPGQSNSGPTESEPGQIRNESGQTQSESS